VQAFPRPAPAANEEEHSHDPERDKGEENRFDL
jgi:hypothetical protein